MQNQKSRYILLDNHLGLIARLSTVGAGVRSLTLHGKPLILEVKDEATYCTTPQLFGKTISRFIGRLPTPIDINGKKVSLLEDTPGICLHGGLAQSMIYYEYEYSLKEDDESVSCTFKGFSKDGECGFPGNLNVFVTYSLSKKENRITISYSAKSDKDTLLSLSNHMYWHLPDHRQIDEGHLFINSSQKGKFKPGSLLITDKEEVPFYLDFRNKPLIKDKLNEIEENIPEVGTLDHAFLFDDIKLDKPQITLEDEKYQINCYTDFEATNVYVDSTLTPVEFTNDPELIHSTRRGIAIEPQDFVANHHVLKANEDYAHYISYEITEK